MVLLPHKGGATVHVLGVRPLMEMDRGQDDEHGYEYRRRYLPAPRIRAVVAQLHDRPVVLVERHDHGVLLWIGPNKECLLVVSDHQDVLADRFGEYRLPFPCDDDLSVPDRYTDRFRHFLSYRDSIN